MEQLAAIIDPFSYRHRLTMPKVCLFFTVTVKYIICATGDEFFMPDSPNSFYPQLQVLCMFVYCQGEKHLYMVPDAEHTLIGEFAVHIG